MIGALPHPGELVPPPSGNPTTAAWCPILTVKKSSDSELTQLPAISLLSTDCHCGILR